MATTPGTGAIRAIFYAEFDNVAGPVIRAQAPAGYLRSEDFDDVSEYIITRPELCGRVVIVVHPHLRVPVDDAASEGGGGSEEAEGGVPAAGSGEASRGGGRPAPSLAAGIESARADPPSGGAVVARRVQAVKILNFPVGLHHEKYPRNTLMFAVAFVLDAGADSRPYEPVLRKLGMQLVSLEVESELLSRTDNRARLAGALDAILEGLNTRGECFVPLDATDTFALKLFPALPTPPTIRATDVPVRTRDLDTLVGVGAESGWDLCLRTLLPHIDGVNYVRAIAEAADVEVALVKRAVQHLLYYGAVALVDIFQYSNIYAVQPRVQLLLRSAQLRAACHTYIRATAAGVTLPRPALPLPSEPSEPALAALRAGAGGAGTDVAVSADRLFRLYVAFGAGSRVCDVCAQCDTAGMGIDDRRLITFGVLHGFLRRIHKYPVPRGGSDATLGATAGAGAAAAAAAGGSGPGGAPPPPASDDGGGSRTARSSVGGSSVPTSEARPTTPALPRGAIGMLDGAHTLEEICCKLRCSQTAMEAAIDAHGGFVYVLK